MIKTEEKAINLLNRIQNPQLDPWKFWILYKIGINYKLRMG